MSFQPMPYPPLRQHAFRWSVHEVTSSWDRRRFFQFPHELYRGDRYWVPPLFGQRFDILRPPAHPSFVHLQVGLFMAESTGAAGRDQVIGTVAAVVDDRYNAQRRENAGFFGLFEVINDGKVGAALLNAAEEWVGERLQNPATLRGPIRLGALDGCGVLADGFDARPLIFQPYNPPYYPELIETAGFDVSAELRSYRRELPLPASSSEAASTLLKSKPRAVRSSLRARPADLARLPADLARLAKLYNRVLADRPGFVAMADAGLERLSAGLAQYVDPALLFFLEDHHDVAGFCLALPDLNTARYVARNWPFPISRLRAGLAGRRLARARVFPPALLPEYRTADAAQLLLSAVMERAAGLGYQDLEVGCVPAGDPLLVPVLSGLGAVPVKTYALYEKRLAG